MASNFHPIERGVGPPRSDGGSVVIPMNGLDGVGIGFHWSESRSLPSNREFPSDGHHDSSGSHWTAILDRAHHHLNGNAVEALLTDEFIKCHPVPLAGDLADSFWDGLEVGFPLSIGGLAS